MNISKFVLTSLMAILVVSSVLVTPVVGAGQASTNQTSDFGETNTTQESIDTDTQTPSEPNPVEQSGDTLEGDQDLEDDYQVNRNIDLLSFYESGSGDSMVSVNDASTAESPTLTEVNFELRAEPVSPVPFNHPVLVTVEVTNSSSGQEVYTESLAVELKPSTDPSEDYRAAGRATFTVNQDSDTQYDVVVSASPINGGLEGTNSLQNRYTDTLLINGESQGASASGSIEQTDSFRTLPSQEIVDSYRVSGSGEEDNYDENPSLPSDNSTDDLYGFVDGFTNMTANDSTAATFQAESGQMNITTRTGFIEDGEQQTLLLRYRTGSSDDIELNLIDGNGSEVDTDTSYNLQNLSSTEQCINGNVTNLCAIELSEEEVSYLNQRGEMFVSYQSSQQTRMEVFCQEVITNALNQGGSACGLSGNDEIDAPTSSSGIITSFGLVDSNGNFAVVSDATDLNPEAASEGLGIEVQNTGSETISSDTPVIISSSLNDTSLSSETDSTTAFNSIPDQQTETLQLSQNYPTQALELEIDGSVDQGYMGVLIQAAGGDKYVQIKDLTGETTDEGTQTIDLSGISGVTDTVTVTLNSVSTASVPDSEKPQVSEVRVNATDIADGEVASTTVGSMTGGGGSLSPGESRTHEFGGAIDVTSQLETNKQVTYTASFVEDQDQITLSVDDSLLVADAGGPYKASISESGGTLVEETVEGDQITRELSTKPYDGLGFGWEQGPAVGSAGGTETWTTEHDNLPEINLTGQDAVDYYTENGYMQFPDNKLPGDASNWSVRDIRYQEYRTDETLTAVESEISNIEGYSRSEMNWSSGPVAGETVSGWKTVEATRVVNNQGELVWNIDEDEFSYDATQNTTGTTQEITRIIEQSSDPTDASPYPRCQNATGSETCWELTDESIQVEQNLDGFYDTSDKADPYICQNIYGYYDPGPEWSLESTDFANYTSVIGDPPVSERCDTADAGDTGSIQYVWYQQKVDSEREVNEWTLRTEKSLVELRVPEEETYYEWNRPRYDTEIVWERPSQGGTTYEWTGPEVITEQRVDSPGEVSLDGSKSIEKSELPVEEYEWRIPAYEESTDDIFENVVNSGDYPYTGVNPTIDLVGAGEFTVELTVRNGELTDTDTTTLDVSKICQGAECEDPPSLDLTATRHSEIISYSSGEIDIEYAVNGTYTQGEELEIVAVPGESVTSIGSDDPCPSGYNRVPYSSATKPVSLADQVDDPTSTEVCEASGDSRSYIPESFIHPEYLDQNSVEFVASNASAEQVVWTGSSLPQNGLAGLAEVDPTLNDAIIPSRDHRTTLELRSSENTSQIYDTTTVSTLICKSLDRNVDNDAELVAPDCGEVDEDFDGEDSDNDECPTDPTQTEKPCDGPQPQPEPEPEDANAQLLRYGQGVDPGEFPGGLDGEEYYEDWNIVSSNTSGDVLQQSEHQDSSDISDNAYSSRTMQLGYDLDNTPDTMMSWISMDERPDQYDWNDSEKFTISDVSDNGPTFSAEGYYTTDNNPLDELNAGQQQVMGENSYGVYTVTDQQTGDVVGNKAAEIEDNFDSSRFYAGGRTDPNGTPETGDYSLYYDTSDGETVKIAQRTGVTPYFDPETENLDNQLTLEYETVSDSVGLQMGLEGPTGYAMRSTDNHWINLSSGKVGGDLSTDLEERLSAGNNFWNGYDTGDGITYSMQSQYEGPDNGTEQAIVQVNGTPSPYVVATTEQPALPNSIFEQNLEWEENPNPDDPWTYYTSSALVYNYSDQQGDYRGLTTVPVDVPGDNRNISGLEDYEVVSYVPHDSPKIITDLSYQDGQGSYNSLASLKVVPANSINDNGYFVGRHSGNYLWDNSDAAFAQEAFYGGPLPDGENRGYEDESIGDILGDYSPNATGRNGEPPESDYDGTLGNGDFDPQFHRPHQIEEENANVPILTYDNRRGVEKVGVMNADQDWKQYLQTVNPDTSAIKLYIDPTSTGSNVADARLPYDPIRSVKAPKLTIHAGMKPSSGAFTVLNSNAEFWRGTSGKIGDIKLYSGGYQATTLENLDSVEDAELSSGEFETTEQVIEPKPADSDTSDEEYYFTKDNTVMDAKIDWSEEEFAVNEATVEITAIPVGPGGVEYPDESFTKTYNYQNITTSNTEPTTKFEDAGRITSGGNRVTTSVENNMDSTKFYRGFKTKVDLSTGSKLGQVNPIGVEYFELKTFDGADPNINTLEINENKTYLKTGTEDTRDGDTVSISGSDPNDPNSTGGIMQFRGAISEEFATNQQVPVKFRVKETGDIIGEQTISTQDVDSYSSSVNHKELASTSGYDIPTDGTYTVEFIIEENQQTTGGWDQKVYEVGQFRLEPYNNPGNIQQ